MEITQDKFKQMQNSTEDIYTPKEWETYYQLMKFILKGNEGVGKTYKEVQVVK